MHLTKQGHRLKYDTQYDNNKDIIVINAIIPLLTVSKQMAKANT